MILPPATLGMLGGGRLCRLVCLGLGFYLGLGFSRRLARGFKLSGHG